MKPLQPPERWVAVQGGLYGALAVTIALTIAFAVLSVVLAPLGETL